MWAAPLQIFIASALLYAQLGYAGLAAVGVALLMLPLEATIARMQACRRPPSPRRRHRRQDTPGTAAGTVMEPSNGMQWVEVLLESHPQMADFKCPL